MKATASVNKTKRPIVLVLPGRLWRYVISYIIVLPILFAVGLVLLAVSIEALLAHDNARQRAVQTEGRVIDRREDGTVAYQYEAKYVGELWPAENDVVEDKVKLSYDPADPTRVFVEGYEDDDLAMGRAFLIGSLAVISIFPVAVVIDYKNARRRANELDALKIGKK